MTIKGNLLTTAMKSIILLVEIVMPEIFYLKMTLP